MSGNAANPHGSTAVPPGNCVTHGYHGKTVCPHCSTAVGPFPDVNLQSLRPVVGVPDRHSFDGIVTITHYGDEIDIDVGGADLVEFLVRMEGHRIHIEVERWS